VKCAASTSLRFPYRRRPAPQLRQLGEVHGRALAPRVDRFSGDGAECFPRKTGARGLRSVMEAILLDSMFELPSLEGVKEVMISQQVVEGTAGPLYIYAGGARAI
jgi:ATP-dependent Clp protease ATP-binding subunit ClpX